MSDAGAYDRAVDSVLPSARDADAAVAGVLDGAAAQTAATAHGGGLSPDAAARGIENAPALGVDPSFAASDEMLSRVAERKMAQRLTQAPALQDFASRSAAHAAVIKDDYEALTPLEWWITGRWEMGGEGEETLYDPGTGVQISGPRPVMSAAPAPLRAFEQGTAGLIGAVHAGKQFLGLGTPGDEWQAAQLEHAQAEDLHPRGLLGKMVTGSAKAVPGIGALVGATMVGGPIAGGAAMFAQGVGPLFRRLKAENPGMSDDDARQWAFSGAGLSATLASLPWMSFFSKTPVVQQLVDKIGQDTIARAVASRATEMTGHALSGAVMVATQSAVEQATVEASRVEGGGTPDWSTVGDAATRGFTQGLTDMALLGAFAPGRALLEDLGRLRQSRLDRAKLDLIEKAAEASPLVGKEPGVAAQVIDNAASRPGAAGTVYVDHAAIAADPDLAQKVASVVGQNVVDEAGLTKGDIPVPMADYLARLVGEQEKLKDDVKLTPDGWTARQAKEWQEAWHGTPHQFAEFDLSKVGTGEGGQSYGHGMYFAQARDLAEHYRTMLTEPGKETTTGAVYRAAIPASDALLDYEKPIAEQPPAVRAALEQLKLTGTLPKELPTGWTSVGPGEVMAGTGEAAYIELADRLGSQEAASEALRKAGVPGLQYKAPARDTRNFVIWDQDRMHMLAEGEPVRTAELPKLPSAAVLRQYAEGLISGKLISDISPGRYRQQEKRAADKAIAAALKGDQAEVRDQQNARTMAGHMARAAETAQKLADAARGYLESRATDKSRALFNKAPPEYGAVADGLLQATGILPNEHPVPGAVDALVQRLKADGVDPAFSVDGVRRLLEQPRSFDQLKLSEAQEVARALRSLRYVAHRTQEIAFGAERQTVQDVVGKIAGEAQQLPDQPLTPADLSAVGNAAQARNYLEAFQAIARSPERLLAKLGATGQALFDRYIAQRNYRDRLSADVTDYYTKAWDEGMPEELKASRYDVLDLSDLKMPAGMDPTRTRTWLWKLMLHMGTETNRVRALSGYGWSVDQVLEAARKQLSAPELRFIQSIWDYNDKTLWPLVKAQEERLNGFAPAKEQAVPFTVELADGSKVEMQGGYFPLKEDPRPGVQPDPSPRSGPGRYLDTEYRVPSTTHGWTQERVDNARYLVNLQWNDVPGHVGQVVHDLAMRETVLDLAKVIDDPTFQRVAVQKLGAEGYQQLPAWLRVVANGRAEYAAQHMNKLTELVGAVRSRVATASVVGSLPVLLGQFSHPLVAMAGGEISVKNAGEAWLRGFSPDVREAARQVFPELLHRYETNQQNFRQILGNVGPRGKVGAVGTAAEKVRLVAHGMQQVADDVVSTQLALGAHADALDKGLAGPDAVDYADRMVRKLMPTHDIAEQSALLRDRGVIGSLLMFHGFLNKIYNVTADKALSAQMAYRQGDWQTVAMRSGQVLGMLAALGVGRYVMGRGPKEDETLGEHVAVEAMLMPSELVPFGRDIMQPFVDALLTDKSVTQAFRDSADINVPAFGFYRNAILNIGKLADSDQETEDRVVAAIDLALAGLRIPRQPLRTGRYLYDVAVGNEQPRGLADFASGVIYGGRSQQRNPASTPLSDFQAALE